MIKVRNIIIAFILGILPEIVFSQTLSKEITVERDIIPEHKDATRLGFTPKISLPPVKIGSIQYSSAGITAKVPSVINVLDPAAYGDSIGVYSWNGYVSAGLFPLLFNSTVSAGYRFINTETTQGGVRLQYDGTVYKKSYEGLNGIDNFIDSQKNIFRNNSVTAGASLQHNFSSLSSLNIDMDYTYVHYNRVSSFGDDIDETDYLYPQINNQGINRLNANIGWNSCISRFDYGISGGVSRFAFVNHGVSIPSRETQWTVDGYLTTEISEKSRIGLNVDFSSIRNNHSSRIDLPYEDDESDINVPVFGPLNSWLLTFLPGYYYQSQDMIFNAGLRVDLSHNTGKALHIAPEVTVAIKPFSQFGLSLHAGGGEMQNTLSFIYDRISKYMSPNFVYSNAHVPITIGANFRMGPINGFHANIYAEYAKANDWLLPVMPYELEVGVFKPMNLSGIMFGAAIGYKYSKYAEFNGSVEFSPQKYEGTGYYLWFDRAKFVVDASIRVTPINPLDLDFSYQLRNGRALTGLNDLVKIGNKSNLCIGATWRFNERFSAFLKGENLLGSNFMEIGFIPSEGINGLAGISYKF